MKNKKSLIIGSLFFLLSFAFFVLYYFMGWRPSQYFEDIRYNCNGWDQSCPAGFECFINEPEINGGGKCIRVNDQCGGLEDSKCPAGQKCVKKYDDKYEVGQCVE